MIETSYALDSATESAFPPPITLTIFTPVGPVHGLWRPSNRRHAAALLLPGRDGALGGPANLFTQLAPALQRAAGVAQLGHRDPERFDESLAGLLCALDALERQGIERVALIGWDFGGALAIAAGAQSHLVTGVACLAPDPMASELIPAISPRRLLFLHGSDDTVIPQSASLLLHTQAGQTSELALFPSETHDFTRYRASILQRLSLWTSALLRSPFKPGRLRDARPLPTSVGARSR